MNGCDVVWDRTTQGRGATMSGLGADYMLSCSGDGASDGSDETSETRRETQLESWGGQHEEASWLEAREVYGPEYGRP